MRNLICITCPRGCNLSIDKKDETFVVNGNKCKKGIAFAVSELTNPTRSVTTTVRTIFEDYPVIPVRTDGEVPKDMVMQVVKSLRDIVVDKKVDMYEVIVENVLGTGVNIISTIKS